MNSYSHFILRKIQYNKRNLLPRWSVLSAIGLYLHRGAEFSKVKDSGGVTWKIGLLNLWASLVILVCFY
ncbi:hypothetical protein HDC33_000126 [Sporosarcina sp. JAI121]|nr:hypothetical protein [Sporosarcina sp. JAI121]